MRREIEQAQCRATAERHGISREQADNCWERLVGCPDCPFKKKDEGLK